jgi:hypothetical protein
VSNTLAYYNTATIIDVKSLIVQAPVVNKGNIFITFVKYKLYHSIGNMLLQPDLMF